MSTHTTPPPESVTCPALSCPALPCPTGLSSGKPMTRLRREESEVAAAPDCMRFHEAWLVPGGWGDGGVWWSKVGGGALAAVCQIKALDGRRERGGQREKLPSCLKRGRGKAVAAAAGNVTEGITTGGKAAETQYTFPKKDKERIIAAMEMGAKESKLRRWPLSILPA
ncbi:hypothetical protein B0F90DRAFT_1664631 [Multifurca ochricompacta]|uniref:Uncharacterized protein n=1 Tax=Multifurca ochricompacta TaxID=376703 RepID=A0AAD4QT65_9AGAM|nr:hypothetical protein B0F90DRAFT_1664631 [Multifurca ochricompacta]